MESEAGPRRNSLRITFMVVRSICPDAVPKILHPTVKKTLHYILGSPKGAILSDVGCVQTERYNSSVTHSRAILIFASYQWFLQRRNTCHILYVNALHEN